MITPYFPGARRVLVIAEGQHEEEIVTSLHNLGAEPFVLGRYHPSPATRRVNSEHFLIGDLMDKGFVKTSVYKINPEVITVNLEGVNIEAIVELEREGFRIAPNSRAIKVAMDRIELRKLADDLNLKSSEHEFIDIEKEDLTGKTNIERLYKAVERLGIPAFIKPNMSSGGLGTTIIKELSEKSIINALERLKRARGDYSKAIVERFVEFDLEVTQLVARFEEGEILMEPIGHVRPGDHMRISWQPFIQKGVKFYGKDGSKFNGLIIDETKIEKIKGKILQIAKKITSSLGGIGVFGVELFVDIEKEEVYFNEVSPRPHDTGSVTMITQTLSEFEVHARAILKLPIPEVKLLVSGACHAIDAVTLAENEKGYYPIFNGIEEFLKIPGTDIRIYGKPFAYPNRRLAVLLAYGKDIEEAKEKVRYGAKIIEERVSYVYKY